jgi:long-chain acyl-CoA synthetase
VSAVEVCIVVDGDSESERIVGLQQVTAGLPATPIADEYAGTAMLYSSGTTGRPKGIVRPLPEQPPSQNLPLFDFLTKLWHYREGMVYLSPAPLYHSAPQAAVNLTIRMGGTVVIMESFDPERYLQLVEQWGITHSQLVPTMFSRMLKLPEQVRTRYDLSTLEIAVHAAAPCPALVKDDMIKWWGPIIHEYYGATEGLGFTACNSEDGSHIAAPSAGSCSATCISWTRTCSPAPRARPAPCGSRPDRHSNISTIPPRPAKRARPTAA